MRNIEIEEADRQVAKEVPLDITNEEYQALQESLSAWYRWRKNLLTSNAKDGTTIRFVGPLLFQRDQQYFLRINRWIGTISSPQVCVHLLPKFRVTAALDIVCGNAWRTFGQFILSTTPAPMESCSDSEMGFSLAYHLVASTQQMIQCRGLRASYVTGEEKLVRPRGRILIQKQMHRQMGLILPVYCQTQNRTYNIPENQLIKSALRRVIALIHSGSMRSHDEKALDALTSQVGHILSQMDELNVQDKVYNENSLPTIYYTRLNEYYRPVCSLAMVLLQQSASLHTLDSSRPTSLGMVTGACWLYNMANEFEQFVRDSLRRSERLEGLDKGYLDWSMQEGQVHMEPDLVLDNRLLIGDVKYRMYSPGRRRSDIFQVLAYSTTSIGTMQDVVLVYASVEESFLMQSAGRADTRRFATCMELDEYVELHDLRDNALLCCRQCAFVVDLLCAWNLAKRIWCCCLDLPHSPHALLIEQLRHVSVLVEKHLP